MAKAKKEKKAKKPAGEKKPEPLGIPEIDSLADRDDVTIDEYIRGVSTYVLRSSTLTDGQKKAGQIRLSNALARAFMSDFRKKVPLPKLSRQSTKEHKLSGALRSGNVDASESHELDGLRMAIEIKPVNLAVGRAIWNRFGDIRTFAVNFHLKFPFSVLGGVLVLPTWEEVGTKAAKKAEEVEEIVESADTETLAVVAEGDLEEADSEDETAEEAAEAEPAIPALRRKDTKDLINRAIARLIRAGGRETEADAAHLLEAIAVVVYDPDDGELHKEIPPAKSGLRWDEFIDTLATTYKARFED